MPKPSVNAIASSTFLFPETIDRHASQPSEVSLALIEESYNRARQPVSMGRMFRIPVQKMACPEVCKFQNSPIVFGEVAIKTGKWQRWILGSGRWPRRSCLSSVSGLLRLYRLIVLRMYSRRQYIELVRSN